MRYAVIAFLMLWGLPVFAQEAGKEKVENPKCIIKTSLGDITVELFTSEAPLTVNNFIQLSEGKKKFVDPKTGKEEERPFYDGLTFHRVVKGFMIQAGCPVGDGTGGPGYMFPDEINAVSLGLDKEKVVGEGRETHRSLMIRTDEDFFNVLINPIARKLGITTDEEYEKRMPEIEKIILSMSLKDAYENLGFQYREDAPSHDLTRGVLVMANSGPSTNGSQFFITAVDTPWLRGRHTVFGKVVQGMDVLDKISNVAVDQNSKPVEDVKILSIRLAK
jgi:cyclophilin family peptidyl-prolyl cis-trans isomerase